MSVKVLSSSNVVVVLVVLSSSNVLLQLPWAVPFLLQWYQVLSWLTPAHHNPLQAFEKTYQIEAKEDEQIIFVTM